MKKVLRVFFIFVFLLSTIVMSGAFIDITLFSFFSGDNGIIKEYSPIFHLETSIWNIVIIALTTFACGFALFSLIEINDDIVIVDSWEDELIWCPSQCYLHLVFKQSFYVIYLRWRHSDPWEAHLIKTDSDFNVNGPNAKWRSIAVKYYTSHQLRQLKIEAELLTRNYLVNGLFEPDIS